MRNFWKHRTSLQVRGRESLVSVSVLVDVSLVFRAVLEPFEPQISILLGSIPCPVCHASVKNLPEVAKLDKVVKSRGLGASTAAAAAAAAATQSGLKVRESF